MSCRTSKDETGYVMGTPCGVWEALRTAAEFVKMDPTYLIPMHCTGEVFIAEAERLMPQKVIRSYVGSKFVFDAPGSATASVA